MRKAVPVSLTPRMLMTVRMSRMSEAEGEGVGLERGEGGDEGADAGGDADGGR